MSTFTMPGEAFRRSILSTGDPHRVKRVFDKARRGEPIVIGVIGGSITQWVRVSTPQNRYANRVTAWFREQFPQSKVTLVNAGRGATGSNYAALRAERDLLRQRPDLVILEFAVNDGTDLIFGETLEGLVRQVLSQPQHPAALMLFMMRRDGANAQSRLATVGHHYGLPMTSYRDALWPEIEAKRLAWDDISPDEVHPNDLGHALAAQCVTHLLDDCDRAKLIVPASSELPAPLYSDAFQHVALHEATSLVPVESDGWSLDAHGEPWPCWTALESGSTATFEVNGSVVLMMFYRQNGPFGQVGVSVDDAPETLHDAWFDQTWGGYRETTIIASRLSPGVHRVRIRLLDERHPSSSGHEFRLLGLGSAGIRSRA